MSRTTSSFLQKIPIDFKRRLQKLASASYFLKIKNPCDVLNNPNAKSRKQYAAFLAMPVFLSIFCSCSLRTLNEEIKILMIRIINHSVMCIRSSRDSATGTDRRIYRIVKDRLTKALKTQDEGPSVSRPLPFRIPYLQVLHLVQDECSPHSLIHVHCHTRAPSHRSLLMCCSFICG